MKTLIIAGIWLTVNASLLSVFGQPAPELIFNEGKVWVTGLNSQTSLINKAQDQWNTILRVYTHDAFVKKINQSIAGTLTWHHDTLSFNPNFSFIAGQQYDAVFDLRAFLALSNDKPRGDLHPCELSFYIPKMVQPSARVESVYPQAAELPENMLRMYISFSNAMMPGEAYEHIILLKADGTPVEKAFLVIDQELWDSERKRLTLLFDPGRIKRGIQSQVDLGTALQAGQTYQLVIDSAWRDANGNSLDRSYSKLFRVTAAERSALSMNNWRITTPAAGTDNDLIIEFDRPMDYLLALKYISITSAQFGKMAGQVTFTDSRFFRFKPEQPWQEDQYAVEADPLLEDVAGNNFNNAFDIDLHQAHRISKNEIVKRFFAIKPLID